VNSRQIPELGWAMVVLQHTDPHQDALLPILGQNLLIALLVSGVALLLLDIDFFKVINDTHGHGIGDQVIQHVAVRLERTSLKGEHGFRRGGERSS
jgi:GGDEF domain-containing protein